jgi:hypothetical protein
MRTLLIASLTLLLLPAAAQAGGFATAGVLNPPENVAAGETWVAQIEILQHGRTPLTDVSPAVIVDGDRFEATPVAGRPGVYTANVKFPRSGRIDYRVDDGFTNAEPHNFVATIEAKSAAAPPAAASSDFPWLPVAGGALAALLLVAAALVLTRRRRGALPA